ncbi:MAG: hypothetical protein NTY19_22255, partial [Planctomycetota bacterium]|nr:hypothetical protein [Planctomycetota bacterium]
VNMVTVAAANDSNLTDNAATDRDNLTPQNNVGVTKVDDKGGSSITNSIGTVVPGTSFTYTITVSNAGPSTAPNVTVIDPVPVGLASFVWSGNGRTSQSGAISDSIVRLAPSATVVYEVTATVDPSATAQLVNTVTVTAANDTNPTNNTATDTDTARLLADLAISKTDGSATYTPGLGLTYTIVVSNNGPSNAVWATVADTFDSALGTPSWTASGTLGTVFVASGSGNLAQPVSIPVNGSITYTVTVAKVNPTKTGNLVNTATVTPPANVTDLTPGNNSATDTDTAGLIGGRAWVDVNGNGQQDAGESSLTQVSVSLSGTSGSGLTITGGPVLTDAQGLYQFNGLAPGDYTVSFTAPAGTQYVLTAANLGSDATDSDALPAGAVSGTTGHYTLASNEVNSTVAAGFYAAVLIGDYLWLDADGNGLQDAGQTGKNGVTMNLLDGSGKPVLIGGVAVTTTTAHNNTTSRDGYYQFANLPPGTYQVAVDAGNFLGQGTLVGFTATPTLVGGDRAIDSNDSPSGTLPSTLDSGQSDQTIDFGYYQPVTLGDYVWVDTNGNGVQDATETGKNGVVVSLLDGNGAPVKDAEGLAFTRTTGNHPTTGSPGYYQFSNLSPGTYEIQFRLPAGYAFSQPLLGGNPAKDSD